MDPTAEGRRGIRTPYMSKLKVEFNYLTIQLLLQLFNYSTIYVKVGEILKGELGGEGVRVRRCWGVRG